MDPAIVAALIGAAAGGTSAIAGGIAAKNKNKTDAQLAADQLAATKAIANQRVAADESMADPFRQQLAQGADISKLDQLERAKFSPVHLGADPNYASHELPRAGGFSYEKSPELISSAAALKQNVMAGHAAPTMTDPNNFGRTAALNLVKIAADGVDPATVGARGVTPSAPGTAAPGAAPNPSGYGYTPPDPNQDLSTGFGENQATVAGAGKGAMTGASIGKWVPGIGWVAGAGIGAAIGAIASRTNTTSNDREKFAQSIGFQSTDELWQHLQQILPPQIAGELQNRALNRIGKHDKAANAQWMQDVQAALGAAQAQGGTTMQPSYMGG